MIARTSDYRAYGLRFHSEIAVPFAAGSPQEEPDVRIRFGALPEALAAPEDRRGPWESAPGVFLLNVDGVARYLISAGRDIVIEPTGGSENAVRTFLLGSVLAACLQQRGILTLHASAIQTGAGAVLFAGVSGSGKSTLLAALNDRGYAMLADDVTGIVLDAGFTPVALSAFGCLKLWGRAVNKLGWQRRTRGRVRDELDKHIVPVERFCASPLPVRAIFMLEEHNRDVFEVDDASVGAAVSLLVRYTYRRRFLRGLGSQQEHFHTVTATAKRVPVARLIRPAHPFRLGALADLVERRLQADPPPDTPSQGPSAAHGAVLTGRDGNHGDA